MADQHDGWEVQWGNTASTRKRTKETSGSRNLRPATDCVVGGDLEPTSVTRREAVQRDRSFLQLAVEDSDATLPYDLRRSRTQWWTLTVTLYWLHKVWPTLAIVLQKKI